MANHKISCLTAPPTPRQQKKFFFPPLTVKSTQPIVNRQNNVRLEDAASVLPDIGAAARGGDADGETFS